MDDRAHPPLWRVLPVRASAGRATSSPELTGGGGGRRSDRSGGGVAGPLSEQSRRLELRQDRRAAGTDGRASGGALDVVPGATGGGVEGAAELWGGGGSGSRSGRGLPG